MKLTMTKRRWLRENGISEEMEAKWIASGARKLAATPTPTAGEIVMFGPIVDDDLAAWWLGDYPEDRSNLIYPGKARADFSANSGDITIRLNSPGGDVASASAIGAMQDDRMNSGASVNMRVDGDAMSAASTLMIRASNRVIDPMGMVMIHLPETLRLGNEFDFAEAITVLRKHGMQIADLYADRTGLTSDKAFEMMKGETYLTAKEAVEHGFADAVLTVDKAEETPAEPNIAAAMMMSASMLSEGRRNFYTSLRGDA